MHNNCYSCKYKNRETYMGSYNGCGGVRNYRASLWNWFISWAWRQI